MGASRSTPEAEYRRRARSAEGRRAARDSAGRRLGAAKVAVAIAGLAGAAAALDQSLAGGVAAVAAFVALIVLSFWHGRVLAGGQRAARIAAFYRAGLDRVGGRLAAREDTGAEFLAPDHPYARDLDLFGPGSVFARICSAHTQAGRSTLARWLLQPAAPAEISARQAAVAELRGRLDLREDLSVAAGDFQAAGASEELRNWAVASVHAARRRAAPVAAVLAAAWVAGLAYWLALGPAGPLVAATAVNLAASRWLDAPARRRMAAGDGVGAELPALRALIRRLASERYSAHKLKALLGGLFGARPAALPALALLERRLGWAEARRHLLVRGLAALIFWNFWADTALDRWRAAYGGAVPTWLDALGEIEALVCIAAYAYERPGDSFPAVSSGPPRFDADGLAHPLLLPGRAVRNDLRLSVQQPLLALEGPNMSGKSTLLRAVGLNAVLAQCGCPVCATRLSMSPLSVYALILVGDSIRDGASRFMAEITRAKRLFDGAAGAAPPLFLWDEILQTTNPPERLHAVRALLPRLVERGAIGVITTHDPAVGAFTQGLAPRTASAHFQDRINEGRPAFDYLLRAGRYQGGNAIALMRSVGLPV